MSKQWGHGFFSGATNQAVNGKSLTGLWFHSFSEDGDFIWQGKVLRQVGDSDYIVQLYEWAMGLPSEQKMVSIEKMKSWAFYSSDADMRYEHHKKSGRNDEDWEFGEKLIEACRGIQ